VRRNLVGEEGRRGWFHVVVTVIVVVSRRRKRGDKGKRRVT